MTLEQIALELTRLSVELHNISKTLNTAAPLIAPHIAPPAPHTSDKNALADLLGSSHPAAPSQAIPPDVMARYHEDCDAYANAFRSLGPMGGMNLGLTAPNLNNYRNDHNYVWPGHASIANAQIGHNPRPL